MDEKVTAFGAPESTRPISTRSLFLVLVPVFGSISIGLLALMWYRVGTAGFFWSLAWLAAGSLLGIIFGIPQEISDHSPNKSNSRPLLRANTNMEQVSDWLTKLLIGAGLVELKSSRYALKSASHFVAASLPRNCRTPEAMESIAASIIIYFVVEGFIGGYLLTRILFQLAFLRSDEILRQTRQDQEKLD